jgi:glycosyltransferase involved in cell wall biosynthesis
VTAPLDVDCVIPTHGRPQYLAEALTSVTGQTAPPARVLVVSDDADPASRDVVATFAAAHPDLELVFCDRSDGPRGASASRNLGAARGRNPLLAFLDDDDLWEPEYLGRAVGLLRTRGVDAVVTTTSRLGPAGLGYTKVPAEGLSPRAVFRNSPGVTGSNLVLTRSAFDAVGGFDPALPVQNDRDLFLRLLESGARYAVSPERAVLIRAHAAGRLTDSSARRADGVLAFLAKHGPHYPWWDRRVHRYVAHYTRMAATGSRTVLARSLLGALVNWSPTVARDLPLLPGRDRVRRLVRKLVPGAAS